MNGQRDSRARILAVDDDRNAADTMRISLSTARHNVTVASQVRARQLLERARLAQDRSERCSARLSDDDRPRSPGASD